MPAKVLVSKLSLDELQDCLTSYLFTSQDLANVYLKRIDEVNRKVHAVINTNLDALEHARALDEERRVSGARGSVHIFPCHEPYY